MSLSVLHAFSAAWSDAPKESDWLIDAASGTAIFRPSFITHDGNGRVRNALVIRGALRLTAESRAQSIEDVSARFAEDTESAARTCRGDFSLAFWNGDTGRLSLVRDHLGRRSMFYRTTPDHIFFCSEIAPLMRPPLAGHAVLDHVSMFWELAFGGPAPGRTLTQGVRQLPAAHVASWVLGAPFREARYWSPLNADAPAQASTAVIDRIGAAIETAVIQESNLEGTTCIAMSGGVDSSLIASCLAAGGDRDLLGVTVRFEDGQEANEVEYAALVASELGIPLEVAYLDADAALELLDKVVLESAEPCAAWASLSQAAVCGHLRMLGNDFLMSGFGADEIFGGYDHFRIAHGRYLRRLRAAPTPAGVHPLDWYAPDPRVLASRAYFPGVARFFDDAALRRYLCEPFRQWSYFDGQKEFYAEALAIKPDANSMELMAAHECQRRIPDIVLKSFNPIGHRYGVSLGYPFLSPDVCELAVGLDTPSRYRTARGDFSLRRQDLEPGFKWTIMQLAESRLPETILHRPRKSFTAPFAVWMRHSRFRDYVTARIGDSALWSMNIVKRSAFDDSLKALEAGPGPRAHMLWRLLTLSAWVDRYAG